MTLYTQIANIERPLEVPDEGLICDLLWSDPDEVSPVLLPWLSYSPCPQDVVGWGENDRGVSYTFGRDIVKEFMEKHNLSLICRAHQVTIARIGCHDDCV